MEKYKNDIINTVMELVKFQSISVKNEQSKYAFKADNENDITKQISNDDVQNAPFGEECRKALDYILNLGKSFGFKTKNIDGYCGYIEFGEGEEIAGIIGHLDVVPADAKDGWTSDPFMPEIRDGKIFGRGTIDDKGPVVAALYAMKEVAETCKVNKRVRLILGLNEEKDWECINYYKQKEEPINIGFSPDADFPCIYAEKGIVTLKLESNYKLDGLEILEFDTKNNAINVVPKYCSVKIKVLNPEEKAKFKNNEDISHKGIFIEEISENILKITASGISAHAAHPDLGENAITKVLNFLGNIGFLREEGIFEIENPKYLGGETTIDESGKLTSNIGNIEYENGRLKLYTNLRVPVNTSFEKIEEYLKELKQRNSDIDYEMSHKNEKLYVSKDSYLIKTLTRIFNEETGMNAEPVAIGGGTYARAFDNCVSFGMTMPGDKDMCHQVDEFVEIDKLILSAKIYAKAIQELAK